MRGRPVERNRFTTMGRQRAIRHIHNVFIGSSDYSSHGGVGEAALQFTSGHSGSGGQNVRETNTDVEANRRVE